jgi:hypothetical protein
MSEPGAAGKKHPLNVAIVDGVVRIVIGVDTLAFAVMVNEPGWPSNLVISDADGFAKDIVAELCKESETGATAVHRMLDKAAFAAIENGSEFVDEGDIEKALAARI